MNGVLFSNAGGWRKRVKYPKGLDALDPSRLYEKTIRLAV